MFTDLDKMQLDDVFFIKTIAGQLAYKVIEIQVIEPTAIEELSIQKNKDLITLLTCTPYMINSHRLIVRGERTKLLIDEEEKLTDISWLNRLMNLLGDYVWILHAMLIILLFIGRKIIKKIRRKIR